MGPQPPAEATALLALMLLHDSRREARLDEAGDLVLLEEQDRRRWNHAQIAEALKAKGLVDKLVVTDAQGDANVHIQQIQSMIDGMTSE